MQIEVQPFSIDTEFCGRTTLRSPVPQLPEPDRAARPLPLAPLALAVARPDLTSRKEIYTAPFLMVSDGL